MNKKEKRRAYHRNELSLVRERLLYGKRESAMGDKQERRGR
jgi:hypothetical protein